jgi:hypothetical protein
MFDLVEERTVPKIPTPVDTRGNTYTSFELQLEGSVEYKLTIELDECKFGPNGNVERNLIHKGDE